MISLDSAISPPLVSSWKVPERFPSLGPNQVHLWCASLQQPSPLLQRFSLLLSSGELERARQFHFPLHRDRFITGRALLRLLLASYLGCTPGDVAFACGPAGKPALEFASALQFNLAHSAHAALFAFGYHTVGVDIEAIRPIPERDLIASSFFAPGECQRLSALPEPARDLAFLRCWTRKESFLKARGDGISAGLKSFEVSFAPDEDARILHQPGPPFQPASLHHLDPAEGFIGALCVYHPSPGLTFHFFQPEG